MMMIFMRYGNLRGEVTAAGYEGWVELDGIAWSASHPLVAGRTAGARREATQMNVGEVTCQRSMDSFSQHLLREGLKGPPRKVEIHVVQWQKERLVPLRTCMLEEALITSYATSHAGAAGRPLETFSLGFQKLSVRFVTDAGSIVTQYGAAAA